MLGRLPTSHRLMRRLVLTLSVLPVIASAQVVRGGGEEPVDTVRHGVFLEIAGAGGLFSLNYEHHFGSMITQLGFSKWSLHFLPAGPTSANAALLGSVIREFPAPQPLERISFELGSGLTGGYHIRDAWSEPTAADSAPAAFDQVVRIRGRYLALTGLAGFRFKPAIAHDITLRAGWVPIMRLRDRPGATPYIRGTLALSAGFTW
jgi:hypothetical protein